VKILLGNDDGVEAPGLRAMAEALRKMGRVIVCAPKDPCSAASSSLTLTRPLVAREVSPDCWAVDGTPVDAMKLALRELLPEPPDLVVSGINDGLNSGPNILYSGTVAAALEGAHYGVTSFAVSHESSEHYDHRAGAEAALRIIRRLAKRYDGAGIVFNINLPAGRPRGVRVAAADLTPFEDRYERRVDPRGRTYYWLAGVPPRPGVDGKGTTDDMELARGWATVTPLRRDLTDGALLRGVARLFRGGR
jgi:5'-nucleotidase